MTRAAHRPGEVRGDPVARDRVDPGPRPPRVGLGRLGYGLLGAPLAWSVQQVAGYALVARACLQATAPSREAALAGPSGGAAVFTAAALVAALAALLTALRSAGEAREAADDAVGSRIRFLALSGVLVSLLFLLAIALNGLPLLLVRRC